MSSKKIILGATLLLVAVLAFSFYPRSAKAQTVEELRAQITELIQPIQRILEQLAQLQKIQCQSNADCVWCGAFCMSKKLARNCPQVLPPTDSQCVCKDGKCVIEKIIQPSAEDPVSGTLSVDKTTAKVRESITLTVNAKDNQGVSGVHAFYQGRWHWQGCNWATTCTKTFTFSESTAGTYTYSGYVHGRKVDGFLEGAYTTPRFVEVKITAVPTACPEIAPACGSNIDECIKAALELERQYPGCEYVKMCAQCNYPTTCNDVCKAKGYLTGNCRGWSVTPIAEMGCKAGELNVGYTLDCYAPAKLVGIGKTCCCQKAVPASSITVLSPNGGERWISGTSNNISWRSTGINRVNIYLVASYRGEPEIVCDCLVGPNCCAPCGRLIASNVPASPSTFTWNVPANERLTDRAKIAIQSADGYPSCTADYSDNYFSITSPVVTQYTLTVSKNITAGGSVISSPSGINCGTTCYANFTSGSTIALTATPASGYTFADWSGACKGTSATCTVTMNSNRSVTANFVRARGNYIPIIPF